MKFHLIFLIGLIFIFSNLVNTKCIVSNSSKKDLHNKNNEGKSHDMVIDYRFANANEASSLILSNKSYFENMNQNDLNYRLQKLNGTVEEMKQYAIKQVLDFTDEEKIGIDKAIAYAKKIVKERGYALPSADNIVFVKTTLNEEFGASAYTHGTQIYLGKYLLSYLARKEKEDIDTFNYAVMHELFHCLTRNNPEFRKDMYNLIGFTIMDKEIEFEFPKEVADLLYSNPDVEHRDYYATLEVNNVKKECVTVFGTKKPFENPGEIFDVYGAVGFVPLDEPSVIYRFYDVTDFLGTYGVHGTYPINEEPEEFLALEFGSLMVDGIKDYEGEDDEVRLKIDTYLKSRKP